MKSIKISRALLVLVLFLPACLKQGGDSSSGNSTSTTAAADRVIKSVVGSPANPTSAPNATPSATSAPSSSLVSVNCVHTGLGTDYQVGPGKTYASLEQVPFESLKAGDTVRIFYRSTPYRSKLMISGRGTELQPIRICGVSGPNGELPIIDGDRAVTRSQLSFPFSGHQPRGLVIIGHAYNNPDYSANPKFIVLEGLKIQHASPEFAFLDLSGSSQNFVQFSAGIFIERGENIIIRGCDLTENNLAIYGGTTGGSTMVKNVTIEGNYIHYNGSIQSYYEHNIYMEGLNTIYQFNRMGTPRGPNGYALGANIKDRGPGTIIRYNWIEDGAHLLDIVDSQEARETSLTLDSFHETLVYGNVMIRSEPNSGSMFHYGGDSGLYDTYRKGTLKFYNNTVVIKNQNFNAYQQPVLFELSTNDEHLDAKNNIFYSQVQPSQTKDIFMLGVRDSVTAGIAAFDHNWIGKGWKKYMDASTYNKVVAQITGFINADAVDPGFVGANQDIYELFSTSAAYKGGVSIPISLNSRYLKHQKGALRQDQSRGLDLGALDFGYEYTK